MKRARPGELQFGYIKVTRKCRCSSHIPTNTKGNIKASHSADSLIFLS